MKQHCEACGKVINKNYALSDTITLCNNCKNIDNAPVDTYVKTFWNLQNFADQMTDMNDQNIRDALTHQIILKIGSNDHKKTSFRAVTEHIRTEMNNPNLDQIYINIFKNENWCKRILDGRVL